MTMRQSLRWGATHGLFRLAMSRGARAGNPDALLLADPGGELDHTADVAALREGRPFAAGTFCPVTVHHDVCRSVLRSEDFGVLRPEGTLPWPVRRLLELAGPPAHPGPAEAPSMLAVDGPRHARYRRLVSRAFTARAISSLRERTEVIAAELLDDVERDLAAGRDRFDLVDRYARRLPVRVICEMLGIAAPFQDQLLAWGDGAALSLEMGVTHAEYLRIEADLGAFHEWMGEHLRRLRQDPGEDLLSRMVTAADDDGSQLTDHELTTTAMLVMAAGFETTVNLIGSGAALLFDHPDQRDVLTARPDLWSNAIEEMLRCTTPAARTARQALRDTAVDGVPVRAGGMAVLLLAAANRDPAVFSEPDRFDVERVNAREHLSFSGGPHFCLGAALARMEAEVALRALFARFPDLQVSGPRVTRPTRVLQGLRHLPVSRGAALPPAEVGGR